LKITLYLFLSYTKGAASQPLIYQTENEDEVSYYSHRSCSEKTYHIKNGVVNSGGMQLSSTAPGGRSKAGEGISQ